MRERRSAACGSSGAISGRYFPHGYLLAGVRDLKPSAPGGGPADAENFGSGGARRRGPGSAIEFLPSPFGARPGRSRVPVLHAAAADATHGGEALLEGAEQALGDVALVGILRAPGIPLARRARAH